MFSTSPTTRWSSKQQRICQEHNFVSSLKQGQPVSEKVTSLDFSRVSEILLGRFSSTSPLILNFVHWEFSSHFTAVAVEAVKRRELSRNLNIPTLGSQICILNRDKDTLNIRLRNPINLVKIPGEKANNKDVFGPSVLLTNSMSLAPKFDEVSSFVSDKKPDLACFTETWLQGSLSEDCLHIPGYNFICRNRSTGRHGGVGAYIKNSIQ